MSTYKNKSLLDPKVIQEQTGRKLTRRMKALADLAIDRPELSNTEIYKRTYGVKSREVAKTLASRAFANANVLAYMEAADRGAQEKIVSLSRQGKDNRLAFDASRDILDRLHGKATQRIDKQSTGVTVNIDLSGGTQAGADA